MTHRSSSEVRETLARFALQINGLDDRIAEQAPRSRGAPRDRGPTLHASEVTIDDWDALLDAVKARLRHAAGHAGTGLFEGPAAPSRTLVLECVDALELLHAALDDRRLRQHTGEASEARRGIAGAHEREPAVNPQPDLAADSGALRPAPAGAAAACPRTGPT